MSDSLMSYADSIYPAGNYMFKVNNRNSRTRCELCSKLTIKITERLHDVVLVSLLITLKHISHLVLVFILNIVHITLNVQLSAAYILCLGDSFRTRTPIFLRKVNLWNTWNALCKIELKKKFKNFKSNSHYLFKVNYRNIRKRWQIC